MQLATNKRLELLVHSSCFYRYGVQLYGFFMQQEMNHRPRVAELRLTITSIERGDRKVTIGFLIERITPKPNEQRVTFDKPWSAVYMDAWDKDGELIIKDYPILYELDHCFRVGYAWRNVGSVEVDLPQEATDLAISAGLIKTKPVNIPR